MATRISDLPQASTLDETAWVPVLIGGITRKTALNNVLDLVTRGTVSQINAGTNIQVSVSGSPQTIAVSFHLPGMVIPYAGLPVEPPDGWLYCNGQTVPRSVFPNLFDVIGTRYGFETNQDFKVPDLRGRIPFGAAQNNQQASPLNGATFASGDYMTLGSTGGSEEHLLTAAQSAVKPHTHTASGTMVVYGGCNDTQWWDDPDCKPPEGFDQFGYLGEVGQGSYTSSSSTALTPALPGVNAALPHNNVPPCIVLKYLIKT